MTLSHDMPTTDDEWKKKLTPEEYRVLREKGTEAPWSGKFLDSHEDGTFKCVACGNPLFSSDAKFDSGTGWPSFDQALPGAVKYEHDDKYGMSRTLSKSKGFAGRSSRFERDDVAEVLCARCGSHLGHVFDDGPANTTGKRFCLNSVCLDLEKK